MKSHTHGASSCGFTKVTKATRITKDNLGASTRTIVTLIAGQATRRFGAGLLLGLAGARAATGVLESLQVGVEPTDPTTFGGIALVLALAALMGCAVPARRATQVDPLVALRTA